MHTHSYPTNSTDWLIRLIAYDTTSSQSNLRLIADIQAFALSLGLSPILTYNDEQTKANLFVSVYNASAPNANGGIVLSGHSDVVPVYGQNWSKDPFCAWVEEGKVFGRGACDMKGFIACCLHFLPKAVELGQNNRLKTPLHLAVSFDEEVGCLGAPLILQDLKQRGIAPAYCIVGEPTLMQVVTAHKGISVYTCSVHGKSVHSSLAPTGVNAISYAAKMIAFIDDLGKMIAQNEHDDAFNVPFSTLSVGTIAGGIATNIVPNLCQFTFEYRNLPGTTPKNALQQIHQYAQDLSAHMQNTEPSAHIAITQDEDVPALDDKDSKALQEIALALLGGDTTKVAYATEGGQFSQAGMATIICGPGSIEQAHKADEFVAIQQLHQCDVFLRRLFVAE